MSWDQLYKKSIDHMKEIDAVDNVFLGYNMDVDMVKHLTQEFLDRNPIDTCYLKEKLQTMDDFFSGLCHAMTHGGCEVWTERDLYSALRKFDYDEERMGGQSGIMANMLSFFDIDTIVVYCGCLSEKQAKFFRDTNNIKIPSVKNGSFILESPKNACKSIEPVIHFIFEYKKGHTINNYVVENDDRFIVSPLHEFPDEKFADALNISYGYALLSGFQLFQKKNFKKNIETSRNHIKKMRSQNNNIQIHYEFTSMQNPEMRSYLVKSYLPSFDSLGMNSVELGSILESLGYTRKDTLYGIYQNILQVKEEMGLKRIHLHDARYHLSVVDREHDPKKQRDALLFASLVACAKAKKGNISSRNSIKGAMEISVCDRGYRRLKELGRAVGNREFPETGIADRGDHFLVGVPTKRIDTPESTVGLGDTVSCLSFVGT